MFDRIRRHGRRLAATAGVAAALVLGASGAAHASGTTVYRITTVASLVLDVSGGSTASGAAVIQWPVNGGQNQEWNLQPVNSGTAYVFANANSGQVLDVPGGTGNWGAQLEQWSANGNPNQNFWFYQLS